MAWVEITLFIIGMLGLIAYILISYKTRQLSANIKVPPNTPIIHIDNSRLKHTEGYAEGLIISQLPRKNDCYLIEFYPTDVSQGKNAPKPEKIPIVIHKDSIKRLARGELSSRREIIKTIPRSPLDIPDKLKDTPEGKEMAVEGQKTWLKKQVGEMIKSGDEAIAHIMTEYARGQISQNALNQIKEHTEIEKNLAGQPIDKPIPKKEE